MQRKEGDEGGETGGSRLRLLVGRHDPYAPLLCAQPSACSPPSTPHPPASNITDHRPPLPTELELSGKALACSREAPGGLTEARLLSRPGRQGPELEWGSVLARKEELSRGFHLVSESKQAPTCPESLTSPPAGPTPELPRLPSKSGPWETSFSRAPSGSTLPGARDSGR